MDAIAVYPGTFDPITRGHIDIVLRSVPLFRRVLLAVAASPEKKPVFALEERLALARQALAAHGRVEVMPFDGLVTKFAKEQGARFLVRGLRAVSDFEYEFQMAAINRKLAPELETLFLMPAEQFNYLSSSRVREVASLGGDVSCFVTPEVEAALQRKRL